MNTKNLWVGVLVAFAIVLFGAGLFLIGNQHKAFRRHIDFYTELENVSGIAKGAKVRVDGMDAGQVEDVVIPSSPAQKFRLKITLDERLHGLVRTNSVVSVETAGLVGDEFLLVRGGTAQAAEAPPGATLHGKEPFEIGKMLEQANGLLTQVGGTITDVQGKLDTALTAVTATVNNTNGVVTNVNGVVTGLRQGRGAAGVLLEDPKTADDTRQIVLNARNATEKLNGTVTRVNGLVAEVQQRQLVAKLDDTLNNAKSATAQLDQTSRQLNTTLGSAFASDPYGQNAGTNLQQSLTNISKATGNLADDSEALKHEFFFKGFFKKRGYDNLDQLPVEPYRAGKVLGKLSQDRRWIGAPALFEQTSDGAESLSAAGRQQLDDQAAGIKGLYDSPLIVEGYATTSSPGQNLVRSRQRATLVRTYLQGRFKLASKESGIVGLSERPPDAAGRSTWDGICLVHLSRSN